MFPFTQAIFGNGQPQLTQYALNLKMLLATVVHNAKVKRTIVIFCMAFSIIAEPTILNAKTTVSSTPHIKEMGVVIANRLNFRQRPNIKSKCLGTLKKQSIVEIIGRSENWLKIKYEGQVGFISNQKRYIRLLTPRIADYNNEVKKIERQIAQSKAEVKAFAKKESKLVDDLYEIEHIFNVARKRQNLFKTDLNTLAKKIKTDEREAETLKEQIRTNDKYADRRLVALYKLSNLGHISLLTSANSVYDFFRRKKALERILKADNNILKQLTQSKIQLQNNLDRQKAQMEEKRSLEQKYLDQIDLMAKKRIQRTQLLAYIRSKKKLKRTVIKNLKQAARSLDRKIKALADELTNERLAKPEQAKPVASKNFLDRKGLLMMPVKGKIVTRFGSYKNFTFNVTNFRSGIDIQADKGEPIRAVCDGKILFANWFKGYGNMVIIDHGDNYYTVYAHIEDIFKNKGDAVETGEVVATVGDSGSLNGPELYFEIRHHGKPIDPLKWLKTG